MKILVPTKRVPDTDQRIALRPDARQIDDAQLPYIINPFDAIALEEAIRIRETGPDEVEILTVGIGSEAYEKELRSGLAMGADRALLVGCTEPLDPWNVARILQQIVALETPDLVLMGKQAVDDDSNQAGQFLAALLDWPQATFASKIERIEEGLRVERETDAGIETVSLPLPAVVTTDLRLNEPRYASLPSILRARKKPLAELTLDQLGVQLEPRVELLSLEVPAAGRSCRRVDSVTELIDALEEVLP
jgi:electron transfer flavoprotein beta subunit